MKYPKPREKITNREEKTLKEEAYHLTAAIGLGTLVGYVAGAIFNPLVSGIMGTLGGAIGGDRRSKHSSSEGIKKWGWAIGGFAGWAMAYTGMATTQNAYSDRFKEGITVTPQEIHGYEGLRVQLRGTYTGKWGQDFIALENGRYISLEEAERRGLETKILKNEESDERQK